MKIFESPDEAVEALRGGLLAQDEFITIRNIEINGTKCTAVGYVRDVSEFRTDESDTNKPDLRIIVPSTTEPAFKGMPIDPQQKEEIKEFLSEDILNAKIRDSKMRRALAKKQRTIPIGPTKVSNSSSYAKFSKSVNSNTRRYRKVNP